MFHRVELEQLGLAERKLFGDFLNVAWRGGPITLVDFRYAFGQRRLQCWYDNGGVYPDILLPNG